MPLAVNKQTLSSRLVQEIGSILKKKKSCNRSRLRLKSVVAANVKRIDRFSKQSIDEKQAHKLNSDMNFNRSKLNSSV